MINEITSHEPKNEGIFKQTPTGSNSTGIQTIPEDAHEEVFNHAEIKESFSVVKLKFTPARLMPHPIEQWQKFMQKERSDKINTSTKLIPNKKPRSSDSSTVLKKKKKRKIECIKSNDSIKRPAAKASRFAHSAEKKTVKYLKSKKTSIHQTKSSKVGVRQKFTEKKVKRPTANAADQKSETNTSSIHVVQKEKNQRATKELKNVDVVKKLSELGDILMSNGEDSTTFSKLLALMDLACMSLSQDQAMESSIILVVSDLCDSRYVMYNCF